MITDELIDRMAEKCIINDDDFDAAVLDQRPKRIQTVTLHHLVLASRSDEFARTIEQADYITADGWPVVSLMRSRGIDPASVTTSEFIERMYAGRQFHNVKAAILGADKHVGNEFRGHLHDSGLHVVFRDHGSRGDWKPKRLARKLQKYDVKLLLIAVTPPFGDMIGEEVRSAGFDGVVINVDGALNRSSGKRPFRGHFIERLAVFVRYILPLCWRRPRA